jgi:hypothetical protein
MTEPKTKIRVRAKTWTRDRRFDRRRNQRVGKQELSARYGAQVSEGKFETEIQLAHRKTKTRREILWAAWGNTG